VLPSGAGLVLRQASDQGLPEYSRVLEKAWSCGALRGRDGQEVTQTARPRTTIGYVRLLDGVVQANPCVGVLYTAFEE
jgi:hypothetical protein